uniref:Uncharacterized protein n=1 Tax=Eutreptiella gymnastica TaxID=73025 RepID=A0A7S1NGA2_9EUGL|mmetsp:Transcript_31081/g.55826  ORF Transcript_31081/g.55826 Transcript_31081/m.55826 type:complete len:110 (+) Transcript_31081:277-606(+)
MESLMGGSTCLHAFACLGLILAYLDGNLLETDPTEEAKKGARQNSAKAVMDVRRVPYSTQSTQSSPQTRLQHVYSTCSQMTAIVHSPHSMQSKESPYGEVHRPVRAGNQ